MEVVIIMKLPIHIHEERLRNMLKHLTRERSVLRRQQAFVDGIEARVNRLTAQLKRAKKLRKDGFDDERFGTGG